MQGQGPVILDLFVTPVETLSQKHQFFNGHDSKVEHVMVCSTPSSVLLPKPLLTLDFQYCASLRTSVFSGKHFHPLREEGAVFLWLDAAALHTRDLEASQPRLAPPTVGLKGKRRRLDLVTHRDWKLLCSMRLCLLAPFQAVKNN